jgi:hypothetical protein
MVIVVGNISLLALQGSCWWEWEDGKVDAGTKGVWRGWPSWCPHEESHSFQHPQSKTLCMHVRIVFLSKMAVQYLSCVLCRGTTTSAVGSAEVSPPRGVGASQRGSGALAGDNCGQQSLSPPCHGSVYFRLMWKWKNQTSENPTQSFEIHNIVWRCTQLLAMIIYIIWYRYLCIIWYYLCIEHQDSRRSTRSVLEYLQNTAESCVQRKHERMVPWPQAAQCHTPTLHLDPPLKNDNFVESSLWDWFVVAVLGTN